MSSHDVNINGIRLHFQTWGEFTQPERSVLLIHGLTANLQTWAQMGPLLAERGWYAIAPDLRGRGQSEKPPHGYGIPYHVNDLLSLCDTLGLPTVNYIGHSLGAQIGYFFAGTHQKRLGKLVQVDAGARIPADSLETIGPTLQRLGQVYSSLDAYLEERQKAPVYQWNAFWDSYFRYDAMTYPDGTVASRVSRAAIEEELAVNTTINFDVLLPRIKATTLITRAAQGTLAPDRGFILPPEEAARVQSVIPGSQLVEISETNHYTIILSEDFTGTVLNFLAEGNG